MKENYFPSTSAAECRGEGAIFVRVQPRAGQACRAHFIHPLEKQYLNTWLQHVQDSW